MEDQQKNTEQIWKFDFKSDQEEDISVKRLEIEVSF